jgi:hypothetical protein
MEQLTSIGKTIVVDDTNNLSSDINRSRVVYICNKWSKICFFVTVLLIFLVREVLLMFFESNVFNIMYLYLRKNESQY